MPLPKIVCSSVIRASKRGDSHGGIYMVDLEAGTHELLRDWDKPDIDWDGRGGDRGVRGMAFYRGRLLAAAGDEVFEFDRAMKVTRSWRSRWLKHTHEIALDEERGLLYVIANIYDAILVLDLNAEKWRGAFILPKAHSAGEKAKWIDAYNGEPHATDHLHLDSVAFDGDKRLYYGGQHIDALYWIDLETTEIHAHTNNVPHSHNLQPYGDGVIYNIASAHKTVCVAGNTRTEEWDTPLYAPEDMDVRPEDEKIAVQGYVRGMVLHDGYVIVGSSPATVNVFKPGEKLPVRSVKLSRDVRNSICGMALYKW